MEESQSNTVVKGQAVLTWGSKPYWLVGVDTLRAEETLRPDISLKD